MVVGPGNVSPLTLGFAKLSAVEEWSANYEPISSRIIPFMTQELKIEQNASGRNVLKIGRSQSIRIQDLERQMSSLSANSSEVAPRKSYSSARPLSSSTSFSKAPIYSPKPNRSALDDHLLTHQKGSKNCYFCQKKIPTQEESFNRPEEPNITHVPSAPKNFRTFQSKSEHNGQRSNCSECLDIAVPLIKMMTNPLPRGDKDKSATLPQRNLGPRNHTPTFKNNLVADLDFIQYRKAEADKSQDIVRLQNYANYQSVCLAQNIDDIAQDVIQTKIHMNGLHSEIDNLEHNQEHLKATLVQILDKLETIQTAVQSLKDSLEQEQESSSPIKFDDLENHASYHWFGASSSSKGEPKQLTLK